MTTTTGKLEHKLSPDLTAIALEAEAIPAERQGELIREYDAESNFRRLAGPVALIVTTIAVVLSSFHIYTAGFGLLVEIKHRTFHLALVLALVFLVFPRPLIAQTATAATRQWIGALGFAVFYLYLAFDLARSLLGSGEKPSIVYAFVALVAFIAFMTLPIRRFGGHADRTSWIDWPMAALAAGISLYLLVFFQDVFVARVGSPIGPDYMMGVLAISMVREATRRTMGPLLA